ncbi:MULTISPECIES: hypothetical protein [Kitasatospora]|uniref:Uncharacterized protein n=1 Tax=Kitasatospora setae (strain ATCC 33774 / DSM 43861 / JCM 3304 / KCC A-0304 / NBRC 14216 / KM-6054) TaxID=452652 RepID=E4N316_KITSK|nr:MULTISPECIES: hypothetical protein [Kitasatospora]BAJ32550.1 hypothetical protein KSE_67920 [Kitasatospora setae KM-6054]
MTLHLSPPPAGALRAVLSALASGAALPPPATAGPGRPRPLLALPVHALRGPAPRLAGAECTGWRFLLSERADPAAPAPCGHGGCGANGANGGGGGDEAREYGPLAVGEFTADGLDGVIAAAEVVNGPDGPVFSHLSAGPFLDSTVRALREAWQLARGGPTRYQPRLLPLPEHYASALWLHGGRPGDDLLIPLAPAPLGVAAHQALPAAELLARLERSPAARATALIG